MEAYLMENIYIDIAFGDYPLYMFLASKQFNIKNYMQYTAIIIPLLM